MVGKKIDMKNKNFHGACMICKKEEKGVTNLVVFPNGSYYHLDCYVDLLNNK